MTLRLLTPLEIESMLDFIIPQKGIPIDTALSLVKINKDRFKKQLVSVKVYPEIISKLIGVAPDPKPQVRAQLALTFIDQVNTIDNVDVKHLFSVLKNMIVRDLEENTKG